MADGRRTLEWLERLLDLPAAERDAALAGLSEEDTDLARAVRDMLQADGRAHPVLDAPLENVVGLVSDPAPADGPSDAPPPETAPPARLGPYRLIRELGRGGMGTVHLARRDDVGLTVALKIVRGATASADRTQRFLRERRLLASLEHPAIARLLDAGVGEDGTPWLAMEYVDGEPLDVACDRRRLGVRGRLDLFAAVCDAVAWAHRNLIIHRDLKPSNVLVDGEGRPHLLDFGIAKLVAETEDDAVTRWGSLPLTPRYASPEQREGGPLSTATDVYSLGLLLAELLTGSPDPEALGAGPPSPAVAADRGTGPAQLARVLRSDLAAVVARATARDPELRYPSADLLADDVRRWLDGRPVRAHPPRLGYRIRRFVGRNRLTVGAAAVAVVALAATSTGMAWQASRARQEARAAGIERDRANREAAVARATADFLAGLFSGADPGEDLGRNRTAAELLDEGERALLEGERLARDPALRARLLEVLGNVQRSAGRRDRSRAALAAAVDLHRAVLAGATGAEGIRTARASLARAVNALAALELEDGRLEEGRTLLEEALALHRASDPVDPEQLAGVHHNLGVVAARSRELDAAAAAFVRAAELRRGRPGADPSALAATLDFLARVRDLQERTGAADSLRQEALSLRRAVLPERHPDIARSLNNIGGADVRAGRLEEAEAAFREVLAIWTEVLGRHPDVAVAQNNLASVLRRQGRFDEADSLFRASLALKRELLPADHPSLAVSLSQLGGLAADRERWSDAERWHRAALEMRRRLNGDLDGDVARSARDLGQVLEAAGRTAEARALYREAFDIGRTLLGPDADWTREVAALLAGVGADPG